MLPPRDDADSGCFTSRCLAEGARPMYPAMLPAGLCAAIFGSRYPPSECPRTYTLDESSSGCCLVDSMALTTSSNVSSLTVKSGSRQRSFVGEGGEGQQQEARILEPTGYCLVLLLYRNTAMPLEASPCAISLKGLLCPNVSSKSLGPKYDH